MRGGGGKGFHEPRDVRLCGFSLLYSDAEVDFPALVDDFADAVFGAFGEGFFGVSYGGVEGCALRVQGVLILAGRG